MEQIGKNLSIIKFYRFDPDAKVYLEELTEPTQCYLATEYAKGGNLMDVVIRFYYNLDSEIFLIERFVRKLFRQIMKGVKHIHERGYAHLRLSTSSIVLNSLLQPKITNFSKTVKCPIDVSVDLSKSSNKWF